MPRSDSGRAAARGGLQEVPGTIIQALRAEFQNFVHETRGLRFPNTRSHHPGAGRASARPSSAEEGSKSVQFPVPLCKGGRRGFRGRGRAEFGTPS